jgi:hypothetical protein
MVQCGMRRGYHIKYEAKHFRASTMSTTGFAHILELKGKCYCYHLHGQAATEITKINSSSVRHIKRSKYFL